MRLDQQVRLTPRDLVSARVHSPIRDEYSQAGVTLSVRDLLRALQQGRGLTTASRALVLQLLTESQTGPHRLKGQMPDGRHLIVVVFVSDSTAADATRDAVIARSARAAWDWSMQRH